MIVGSRVPASSIRLRTISRAVRSVLSSVAARSASDSVTTMTPFSARASISVAPTPVRLATGCASPRTTASAASIWSGFEMRTRNSSAGPPSSRVTKPKVSRPAARASRTTGQ